MTTPLFVVDTLYAFFGNDRGCCSTGGWIERSEIQKFKFCRYFSIDFREQVASWESLCAARLCRHPQKDTRRIMPATHFGDDSNDESQHTFIHTLEHQHISHNNEYPAFLPRRKTSERAFESTCRVTRRKTLLRFLIPILVLRGDPMLFLVPPALLSRLIEKKARKTFYA